MEDLDSLATKSVETRIELDRRAVKEALAAGVLDVDEARGRAQYHDGQLLGAEGFRRDHATFDRRQRDLATIVDAGVVAGLQVRRALLLDEEGLETDVPDPSRLFIAPGHGVTRGGETIVVGDEVTIDLTELPVFQQLDSTFALDRRPREPARTQSGVFALALRSIRYTANPVAPYPTSITGERRLEDGDIVDASLVTLVPIDAESSLDGVDAGPAALARRVFAEGLDLLPAADALPIAVVALTRGQVAWIDVDIGRRTALADPTPALAAGHRSALEAHLRHFEARMAAILEQRASDGVGTRFAATDYFEVLPPVGRLPASAVSVAGDHLIQWFFPSSVEADLALIPDDELPALIEEAIALGPIALSAGAAIAEASPMMVVIPVPRSSWTAAASAMGGVLRQPIGPRLGSLAYRRPIDAILRRFGRAPAPGGSTVPALVPWQEALDAATSLYFLRQRRRPRTPFALARYGPMPEEQRPSGTLSQVVFERIQAAGELERFDRMLASAGAEALERVEALFSLPLFGSDPLFVNGVIAELSSRTRRRLLEPGTLTVGGSSVAIAGVPAGAPAPLRVRPLRFEEVDTIAVRYEGDVNLGDGMLALRALEPELDQFDIRLVIAQSLRLPELDRRTRATPAAERLGLAGTLLSLGRNNDVSGIRDVVGYVRAEPPPLEVPRRLDGTPSTGFAHASAIGQAGLFALLWRHGDEAARARLDNLFAQTLARQSLASVILMTTLFRAAWNVSLAGSRDVWALIERLYRWPFTPSAELRLPTLSTNPLLNLSPTNPALTGIFNMMDTAQSQLATAGIDLSQTSAQFEAAGFPGHGLARSDAYRILGCAFGTLDFTIITGAVRFAFPADFPGYVAAVSAATRTADIAALQAILADWRGRV